MDIHGSQVPFGQDLHERAACELAPEGPQRRQNDSHGVIAYAEVNADYTRRPEPSAIFPVLEQLGRQRVA
jgi:hypothetical protein